ncbi:MAG: glycine--tRNA ligase [Planctomycetota bacterium]
MSSHIDPKDKSMDELVALAKRCGFVYPASDIYGGLNGFWDYGPLGVALKNNIRDSWWKHMVDCPPIGPDGEPVSIVGLDSSIIQNPKTWVASGHVGGFNDPMVDCTETKSRYREDQIDVFVPKGGEGTMYAFPENQPDHIAKTLKKASVNTDDYEVVSLPKIDFSDYARIVGPDTNKTGTLTEPRLFNLMFETYVGAIRNEDNKAYLRPETAQGIFLNYKNVLDTMRVKVPFGIAQIGKSFRNEVTPRNFIFRSREFEQMEMEWFCPPEDSLKWYNFWKEERMRWWKSLGIHPDNLIFRDHDDDELAHYSQACVDVEYKYPFTAPGFGELEGVAHRGDFDLSAHQEHARTKLEYFDQAAQLEAKEAGLSKEEIDAKSKYIPHVIEPASGLTRAVLVLLCEAFTPTPDRKGSKYTMMFKPSMAPIKAAVFPLVNKDGMPEKARELYDKLRLKHPVQYDAKQSIGKRYARMDECGTPYCVTVDGDTLADGVVTVRDRDTADQIKMHIDEVEAFLDEKISA